MLTNHSERSEKYEMGFGGCQAPAEPVPCYMPGGSLYEIPRPLLVIGHEEFEDMVATGGMYMGFGGCRAPQPPTPAILPGSATSRPESEGTDEVGPVIWLGFGGCQAPSFPVPMNLPGAPR